MQPKNELTAEFVKHESGLKFRMPEARNTKPNWGLTCFGAMLNNPQFKTLSGFAKAIDDLDGVEERPVCVDGKEVEGYKAIVSHKTNALHAITSSQYQMVQDYNVAQPLYEAAKARKLTPFGSIKGVESGHAQGYTILTNPDFTVNLLTDHKDPFMLGMRWWNSFHADRSFGGEMFGVRMVCCNFNLWGEQLAKFSARHVSDVGHLMEQYTKTLDRALDNIPTLKGRMDAAYNTAVLKADVPDILWGIELPESGIDLVSKNPVGWCPEVKTYGLNKYTLYQAVTAYVTYRPQGARFLESTRKHAEAANKILTVSLDKLIENGKAKKEAHAEAKDRYAKARKERREKKKVAVPIPVVQ